MKTFLKYKHFRSLFEQFKKGTKPSSSSRTKDSIKTNLEDKNTLIFRFLQKK